MQLASDEYLIVTEIPEAALCGVPGIKYLELGKNLHDLHAPGNQITVFVIPRGWLPVVMNEEHKLEKAIQEYRKGKNLPPTLRVKFSTDVCRRADAWFW